MSRSLIRSFVLLACLSSAGCTAIVGFGDRFDPDDGGPNAGGDGGGDGGMDGGTADAGGPRCGDGVLDDGEQCDGAELRHADCVALGDAYVAGALACSTDRCEYDLSACTRCGNGAVDEGEDCDGTALGAGDCASEGFPAGGVLGCTSSCEYDTSACLECMQDAHCPGNRPACDTTLNRCFPCRTGGPTACGPVETCGAGNACTCGTVTSDAGPACLDDSAAPDCSGGRCTCGGYVCGMNETCTGVNGDCACGASVMSSGEACSSSANPDCDPVGGSCFCAAAGAACNEGERCMEGVGCVCGTSPAEIVNATGSACGEGATCSGSRCRCTSGSSCGPREVCMGELCVCGTIVAADPWSPACDSPNPECFPSTGCGCGDAGTTCDADEACTTSVGGDCRCPFWLGSTQPNGPACPDSNALAPSCNDYGRCGCGADNGACGPGEICDPATSRCSCGSNSSTSNEACRDDGATPECNPGVGCTCPCTNGFVCRDGRCECDSSVDCLSGGATCTNGVCVCGGFECPTPGMVCSGDTTCSCTGGSCVTLP